MRQILLVVIFLACAMIDSPEDYTWMENEYVNGIISESIQSPEDSIYSSSGYDYDLEPEVVADDQVFNEDNSRVFRF